MKSTASSLASFAPSLFGSSALFDPDNGHAFDDKRFDPLFRRGLFWRVASAGMARLAVDRQFPVEEGKAQRTLPTLADLEYLKNLVKVLRAAGRVSLRHSHALNAVAGFWGFRSWGAMQDACRGALESRDERCAKLAGLAAVVVQRLAAEVPDCEFADLVQLAVGIPVLEFTFEDYPGAGDKPVLRTYANGVAHVTLGSVLHGYRLEQLHLQAVDCTVGRLPAVSTLEQLKACTRQDLVRAALWSSAPSIGTEQLRSASDAQLQSALEEALPMTHYAVFTHRANAEVHGGLHDVVLGLPAYADFAVAICTTLADGDSVFGDEPSEHDRLALAPR